MCDARYVQAVTDARNHAAKALLERLGMTPRQTLPGADLTEIVFRLQR